MKRAIIFLSLSFSLVFGAKAQLTGNVAVEGEFDPLVIETERLGEYPAAYRFELPQLSLSYDAVGKATDFSPSLLSMGVTGWNVRRIGNLPRGYVDLRMGSFLNSRLDAGVWALRDSVNTLSADLRFHSTSLYKSHGFPETYTAAANRKLYDGTLGVNYARLTGSEGLFTARADYRVAYFNYYGSTSPLAGIGDYTAVPTQTLNQVNVRAGYSSSPSLLSGWHAGASVGFTAYRRFIYPDYWLGEKTKGDGETRLNIDGGYNFRLGDRHAIAIDADADLLFYAGRSLSLKGYEGDWRKDYGIVTLTPAYRLESSGVKLQAGIDVDLAFDAMGTERGKNFGTVHLAPDIKFDYRGKQFGLYLAATGGTTPVTLAGMEKFDLYQMPMLLSTQPVYSPIDARIGVCLGPYAGFSADLSARYTVANGTPLGGWYQTMLGTYEGAFGSLKYYGEPMLSLSNQGERINLHGLGVTLDLRYRLEEVVEALVKSEFTPQRGKFGIFNGFDRPRFTVDAKVAAYPIKRLKLEAAYSLRALRAVYGLTVSQSENRLCSMRLPNVSELQAKISYRLFDTFDLYVLGENLLNRRIDILPGLQCNGIALSGGIYWEF